MTLEQEFEKFFTESYTTHPISSDQKREIKMNFFSGAFIATRPSVNRQQYYDESQLLIRSYINTRFKEDGIGPAPYPKLL